MTADDIATIQRPLEVPFCTKCQKPVDYIEVETPLAEQIFGPWDVRMVHTGERIVTIRCHGEQFKISNWRGEINDR